MRCPTRYRLVGSERRRAVMTLQQEISQHKHQALVGRQMWALVGQGRY